jgi:hypothetical protein
VNGSDGHMRQDYREDLRASLHSSRPGRYRHRTSGTESADLDLPSSSLQPDLQVTPGQDHITMVSHEGVHDDYSRVQQGIENSHHNSQSRSSIRLLPNQDVISPYPISEPTMPMETATEMDEYDCLRDNSVEDMTPLEKAIARRSGTLPNHETKLIEPYQQFDGRAACSVRMPIPHYPENQVPYGYSGDCPDVEYSQNAPKFGDGVNAYTMTVTGSSRPRDWPVKPTRPPRDGLYE